MSEQVLNELQLLTSMYDTADITFHDPEVLSLVENCIPISDSASLTIRLNPNVELDIRIPLGYPETERLSAHCRISQSLGLTLDRNCVQQWESQFNNDLFQQFLSVNKGGGDECPDVLGVIQRCNEQLEEFSLPSQQCGSASTNLNSRGKHRKDKDYNGEECCRIWIYSHHIYNKHKRKFLVNTAEELGLSGFSLPGKPGFICVEGAPQNCDEYWSRVRQLCWQKISLIERQVFHATDIIFQNKPFEELHCDKSDFIKFLEQKNSSSIIKEYLGI